MKKTGIILGMACIALFSCTKNEMSKLNLSALDASKKASPEAVISELSGNGGNGIIKDVIPNDELMEIMGQTPVDIPVNNTVKFKAADPEFHYEAIKWDVVNNGTTYPGDKVERNLKVNVSTDDAGKNYVVISGIKYDLLQFHFHYSSEHAFMGKKSAMEVHLVHKSADGKYAVLGALIKIDEANEYLGEFFEAAPAADATEANHIEGFDPSHLLPENANLYYTYSGSLTTPGGGIATPPYLEGLTWIVFKGQKTISEEQFNHYKEVFEEPNSREIQPLGTRVVYEHVGRR